MILRLLLNIFGFIGSTIINMVTGLLPDNGTSEVLVQSINLMLQFVQQALNFCYLLFGDTIYFVLPIATVILTMKYTVIPLVTIFRSFFVNSNT